MKTSGKIFRVAHCRSQEEIIRSEQMLNFNPVTSDMDFKILKEEVGKIENEK